MTVKRRFPKRTLQIQRSVEAASSISELYGTPSYNLQVESKRKFSYAGFMLVLDVLYQTQCLFELLQDFTFHMCHIYYVMKMIETDRFSAHVKCDLSTWPQLILFVKVIFLQVVVMLFQSPVTWVSSSVITSRDLKVAMESIKY